MFNNRAGRPAGDEGAAFNPRPSIYEQGKDQESGFLSDLIGRYLTIIDSLDEQARETVLMMTNAIASAQPTLQNQLLTIIETPDPQKIADTKASRKANTKRTRLILDAAGTFLEEMDKIDEPPVYAENQLVLARPTARPVPAETNATTQVTISTAGSHTSFSTNGTSTDISTNNLQLARPIASSSNYQLPQHLLIEYSASSRKTVSVASFVDFVKAATHPYIADTLKLVCRLNLKQLTGIEDDIRKYLFHLSRNTLVVSGTVRYDIDGLHAGIYMFRVAAHTESITAENFKTLVRQYMVFLDSIKLRDENHNVINIDHIITEIFNMLDRVDFPNGFTYPPRPGVTYGGVTNTDETDTYNQNSLQAQAVAQTTPPAINIRELHRRKLCAPCRHYLRGMCYRGDKCNFCHNPEHDTLIAGENAKNAGQQGRGMYNKR